jgi:hypothetical protein
MPKQINDRLDNLERKQHNNPAITLDEYYSLPDDMKDELNEPYYGGKGKPLDGLNVTSRILKWVDSHRKRSS